MIINIGTPCYYSKYHSIDPEIIALCEEVKEFFENREYSESLRVFDVEPVVAPTEVLKQGLWQEEIIFSKSIKRASVFKHIDYDLYSKGTIDDRVNLTIQCIIGAAENLGKKKSVKFDSEQFSLDLLDLLKCE